MRACVCVCVCVRARPWCLLQAWVCGRRETGDDKSQSSHVSFLVLKGWDLPPGLSSLSDALRYLRWTRALSILLLLSPSFLLSLPGTRTCLQLCARAPAFPCFTLYIIDLDHTSSKKRVFLDRGEVVNQGTAGHAPKQWPAKFPWALKKEAAAEARRC